MSPLGENVLQATSGSEALRLVLTHDIAVILMDVQMPIMDGFETAAMIRGRDRSAHIPIIFVTAFSKDSQAVIEGYSIGAVDYIAKPFNAQILLSKVRVFVDLYKKNEQLKRQAQLLYEHELHEAARRQREREEQQERERLKALQAELERRVAERTAQLVEANSEMEAFCYSVSHDLRAPLRAIMSTSMILMQDAQGKLTEDEIDQLHRQSKAAKKMGALIDDLLHLSRLGRRKLELVGIDFSLLASEIADELRAKFPDRSCEVVIQEGMTVRGDQGLIKILLHNLVENAIKYSPEGGQIDIGVELQEGDRVYLVRDRGIGFDMKYSRKLFLPFERLVLDSEFPGTGIGLAIVHRIIHRHGGRIWVQAAPGDGATFYFTLPS